jgi:TonB-linked SusC/RagA family outer membrane protein
MRLLRLADVRGHLFALAVGLCAPALALAQQSTITGRVTSGGNGTPLIGTRVFLVGGTSAAATNADGRYTLRSTAGSHEVRVLRVGFTEQKRTVVVPANGNATLDFVMTPSVVRLDEVVTTATGQQRRSELGNSVQTLGDIGKNVEQGPVKNLTDLLVAKAPGVQVQSANMTGGAPVVRIRGIKSLSLTSEPIYVIDGVRLNNTTVGIGTGGTTVSLLNVLNTEEIADIEIVKGPSAATLYGTDAANGVIVVTTKKGLSGPARWTMHAATGLVQDRNNYPTQYAIFGHAPATPTVATRCTLITISAGSCVADSTTSFNLLADPYLSPIKDGNTKQLGLQVSGGSDIVRYFVSGDYEGERGPLELPAFSQRYLDSTGNAMREEWLHPENFSRKSVRGNLNSVLSPKLDLSFNSGYTRSAQQLPPVDNNTASFVYNAFNNPGFKPTVACRATPTPASCLGYSNKGQLGEELGGYGFFTPGNLFQRLNTLNVDRFISSSTSQYRPLAWLQGDATLGYDMANRDVVQMCRFGECQAGTNRQGFVFNSKTMDRNLSAKGSATATWQPKASLNLRTTAGVDYVNQQTEFASGEGDNLPPGAQTAGAGAVQFATSSFTRANKTLGYYGQEQVSFNDRLFVIIAARTDQNSAFGTQFQRVIYPKGSVSYILSDEPFFPKFSWLDQFRLRGAYGASGVQPGSTTALQTYGATSLSLGSTPTSITGADTPALLAAALGNPELKPERSTERELGFETRMFSSKVSFEMTYYNNLTKDALINQPIAGSSGASSTGLNTAPTVTRNLGSIRNSGIEATLTTTILDTRNFGWDMTVGGSHNTNKIESLGESPCVVNTSDCLTGTKPNPTIGTGTNRDSLGLPIRGIFARDYTYNDANNDGIITANEVFVDANVSYLGSAVPRDLVTVQNGFDLFDKKLRLNILLDYKGGFSLFNSTTQFYCLNTNTCYDITHKEASLEDQARLVAMRFGNPNTLRPTTTRGYFENGQFWRLREVGATLQLPSSLASRAGLRDASLTFSGRNLHVWTKYKGTDPESGYTVDNLQNVQNDFSTLSPPTYFSVRLNVHY